MSQYADDTTLIFANDYSITSCFHIVHIFENGSASHLNTTKTEGVWIGRLGHCQTGPVNITWVTDKLKILGLYFGHANLDHANWDPRLAKLTNRLNSWKQLTLSLHGKVLSPISWGPRASGIQPQYTRCQNGSIQELIPPCTTFCGTVRQSWWRGQHAWLRVSALCAPCGLTKYFSHTFCEYTIAPQVWAWVF